MSLPLVDLDIVLSNLINLRYDDQVGSVIIRVDQVPANYTIFRVGLRGNLEKIRGYSDNTSWISGGTGIAYDYEMPMGAIATYCLSLITNSRVQSGDLYNQITIPGNIAWLRDPAFPLLSRKVVVISINTETEQARQAVFPIAGKRKPVVVWDVREGRTGSFQLLVINKYPEDGSRILQPRDDLEYLFSNGDVLLLSMCYNQGFENLYFSAPGIAFNRISDRPIIWAANDHSQVLGLGVGWVLDVEYIEVDNPIVDVNIPVTNTYQLMLNRPIPAATYNDWYKNYIDYADVLLDRPIGG